MCPHIDRISFTHLQVGFWTPNKIIYSPNCKVRAIKLFIAHWIRFLILINFELRSLVWNWMTWIMNKIIIFFYWPKKKFISKFKSSFAVKFIGVLWNKNKQVIIFQILGFKSLNPNATILNRYQSIYTQNLDAFSQIFLQVE